MDRVKPMTTPHETKLKRAHDRLDQFTGLAQRERLWGDILIKVKIEDGEIVKVGFAPDLGEKF
jgi:hypothetical protein